MNLLVLGAGYDQLPMIRKSQELGHRVHVCDRDAGAPGMPLADVSLRVDTADPGAVTAAAREHDIVGICTMATNLAPRTAAIACERLGLPSITRQAAFASTDKAVLRSQCIKAGIPIAQGRAARDPEEAVAISSTVGYPVLLKPSDSSGCRGIQVVRDSSQVRSAFCAAQAESVSKMVVVEQYYGKALVFGVESLISQGETHVIIISDKIVRNHPVISTAGVTVPTVLSQKLQERVEQLVIQIHHALGLTMGASHIDFLWDGEEPIMIDIGPRLAGGSLSFELAPKLTGIDMLRFVIEQCLGSAGMPSKKPVASAGIERFFYTPCSGILEDYQLPAPSRDMLLQWRKPIGALLTSEGANVERLGFVTAIRPTIQEAEAAVQEKAGSISLTIRLGTGLVVRKHPVLYQRNQPWEYSSQLAR